MGHEALPKAELHCHLIGVIDADLLRDLERRGHRSLADPDRVVPVRPGDGAAGFVRWLEALEPYKRACWLAYLPILGSHIEALVRQNVTYAELIVSPLMFSSEIEAAQHEFAAFRRAVDELAARRIELAFLFVIPRSLPEALLAPDRDRTIALHEAGLVAGISIAGMEQHIDLRRFAPMLRALKDKGLGIEVHAGELTGPEEVWVAIDELGADRIGHGLGAFRDAELVGRLGRDRIHLEFCPSSNLATGAVASLAEHPLSIARDRGLSYSINTDDPGAFDCSMTSEIGLAADTFDLDEQELRRVYDCAVASRFGGRRKGAANRLAS